MLVWDNVTNCRASTAEYLLAKLPNTVYSCNWHDMVAATRTSERPGIVIPVSKTFTLL
jgi:hypothetical protein